MLTPERLVELRAVGFNRAEVPPLGGAGPAGGGDAGSRIVHRIGNHLSQKEGCKGDTCPDDSQDERIFRGRSTAIIAQKPKYSLHVDTSGLEEVRG